MNPDARRGVLYGIGAYGLWGVFPLYFRLLERSGALEVVLHRVLWSLLVCLAVVAAVRGWAELRAVLGVPRHVVTLGVGAVLLALNWGVYIYAVNSGQVVEASLGYYINPLVTVLLGVLVLRERLRSLQWAAVGVGALAVAVLTAAYGRPPFIALTLALSFGLYGLSTIGLLQYLTPTLQLLCGVVLLGERMSAARWAGFALVWVALVVLTADTVRAASRRRTETRIAEPVGAA